MATTIERRIRIKEFCECLSRSRPTFHRWRKNGKIPKEDGRDPYPYWLESTVHNFVTSTQKSA